MIGYVRLARPVKQARVQSATVGVAEHGNSVALVDRVREAALRGARESLEALAGAVPFPIGSIAIRECPKLPPMTEARIADTLAANVADSVMYREALAISASALGREEVGTYLQAMGRAIGPPWQARQKLAAAAALAATARRETERGHRSGTLKEPLS